MSTYGFPQHITTGNSSTSTVTITPSNSITAITGTYSELDPIPNTISLGNTRITEEQL